MPGTPLVRQVTKVNAGGFQELAGAQVLSRLGRELGIDDELIRGSGTHHAVAARLLTRAAEAAEAGEDGPYVQLLDRFATGLATGLASMIAVLDPEIVVLSGEVIAAGGEPLRCRVESELTQLVASRPRLIAGDVKHRPVLRGALESALATTRDEVFDTSR